MKQRERRKERSSLYDEAWWHRWPARLYFSSIFLLWRRTERDRSIEEKQIDEHTSACISFIFIPLNMDCSLNNSTGGCTRVFQGKDFYCSVNSIENKLSSWFQYDDWLKWHLEKECLLLRLHNSCLQRSTMHRNEGLLNVIVMASIRWTLRQKAVQEQVARWMMSIGSDVSMRIRMLPLNTA